MRVALMQMDIAWHDRKRNYGKVRQYALRANEAGADLFILPEMFSTGFSLDTAVTAESFEGETHKFLRSVASERSINVIGGFVLLRNQRGPQNVSLTVDRNGKDLSIYSKIHLISLLGEDTSYEAGDKPVPFYLDEIGTTCFICYDLRFPELFRAVANECKLVIVIASWPETRQAHWDVLLRARAVENQCYILGVNRVGEGGGYTFTGGSAIIDPLGNMIAHGGEEERLIIGDIDAEMVDDVRSEFSFLRDRKSL